MQFLKSQFINIQKFLIISKKKSVSLASKKQNELLKQMKDAFPSKLHQNIDNIFLEFDIISDHFHEDSEIFYTDNNELLIPTRIYINDDILKFEAINPQMKRILFCYFTRHHNGYTRQYCLKEIIKSNYILDYEIPYIFRLSGEYVVEILYDIVEITKLIPYEVINKYVSRNISTLKTMERRMISYWSEYYRYGASGLKYNPSFIKWENYPAHDILAFLKKHGYESNR